MKNNDVLKTRAPTGVHFYRRERLSEVRAGKRPRMEPWKKTKKLNAPTSPFELSPYKRACYSANSCANIDFGSEITVLSTISVD